MRSHPAAPSRAPSRSRARRSARRPHDADHSRPHSMIGRHELASNAMSWRFIACAALFVTCLLTANTIAAKLIVVGGIVLTAGIVIFPISYVLGDVLTEVWGYAAARRVIWLGF